LSTIRLHPALEGQTTEPKVRPALGLSTLLRPLSFELRNFPPGRLKVGFPGGCLTGKPIQASGQVRDLAFVAVCFGLRRSWKVGRGEALGDELANQLVPPIHLGP
jgi:hypothetical protein